MIVSRITTASLNRSLYEEVSGYGGSSCLTSFNIVTKGTAVICPNTAQQRTVEKSTAYTVAVPYDCPSTSSSGGYYVPPPSGGTYYTGGGTPTQTGVGGSASTYTTALNTGNNCECKDNCEKVCGKPDEYCIKGKCTKVTIDYVDARVDGKKGVFVEVQELLSFTGNKTGQSCEFQYKWNLGDGRTEEAQNLPFKYYVAAGVYYPSFTVSCKKCGPSKSDQVMVVVGCPDTYADPTMCCAPTGKLIPNKPIEDFSQCPNRVQNPNWAIMYKDKGGYDYDGCTEVNDNPAGGYTTAFSNSEHTGACDEHDRCYQTCWLGDQNAAREACDKKFLDVALQTCKDSESKDEPQVVEMCKMYAHDYYDGLRALGWTVFPQRQAQVCNCCR